MQSQWPTAAAIALVASSLFASQSHAEAPAVPIVKGAYVLTDVQLCTGKFQSVQLTGLATFNTTTGKIKLEGFSTGGDPLVLNPVKQTLSYSNSATTLTLGDTVYQAFYGKLDNGVATYLSLIAAADPCAAQITLSRQ